MCISNGEWIFQPHDDFETSTSSLWVDTGTGREVLRGELFDKIIDSTNMSGCGCLPEDEAAGIVRSLLEAVEYLHDRDIVHRDIKPENILLEPVASGDAEAGVDANLCYNVRLIDFGLAKRHRRDDAPMTDRVGTSYYISPEILEKKYDRACDLWSIGVVAFILLTGTPPFDGDTDADIHDAILEGWICVQMWDDIGRDAKRFLLGLLNRDPRKRFTVEEALRHPWMMATVTKTHTRAHDRPRRMSI